MPLGPDRIAADVFPPSITLRPSSSEVALERMANALEKLVAQQEQPEGSELIFEWLSTLDHNELDDAVMRRQSLGTPVMFTVLEVLTEWAASARP